MAIADFEQKHDVNYAWGEDYELPCFAGRFAVEPTMNTEADIKDAIKYAKESCENSIILFSVTAHDGDAWQAWADFAEKHPKTFQIIEGTSSHGPYKCRMYFYKRPVKKDK